jgi:hypothetical protein
MPCPRRPVPIDLKVADLDQRERLSMECPIGQQAIGRQGYDLSLELPARHAGDPLRRAALLPGLHQARWREGPAARLDRALASVGAESGHRTQWRRFSDREPPAGT